MVQRTSVLVVTVAAVIGVGLANVAHAVGDDANPVVHGRAGALVVAGSGTAGAGHHAATPDEGEPDDRILPAPTTIRTTRPARLTVPFRASRSSCKTACSICPAVAS